MNFHGIVYITAFLAIAMFLIDLSHAVLTVRDEKHGDSYGARLGMVIANSIVLFFCIVGLGMGSYCLYKS